MTTPTARSDRPPAGRMARFLPRLLVLMLLTLAAGVGLAGPAAAHNVLTSSDPTNGSTLQAAPTTVRLTFDQPVQDFEPVVTVILAYLVLDESLTAVQLTGGALVVLSVAALSLERRRGAVAA